MHVGLKFERIIPSNSEVEYSITWNYPPPSNSHHQDYSIFSGESLFSFTCDCYWLRGRPKVSTMNVGEFSVVMNCLKLYDRHVKQL